MNFSSLTFVRTDFVRRGAFVAQRLDEIWRGALKRDAGAGRTQHSASIEKHQGGRRRAKGLQLIKFSSSNVYSLVKLTPPPRFLSAACFQQVLQA